MNHAARIIQGERNNILKKNEIQVAQIKQLNTAMQQNVDMLQSEVMRVNEERQDYNGRIKLLNAEIRELKKTD